MALEIELKARVHDPEQLQKHLDHRARYEKTYRKEDMYFGRDGRSLFRLRRQADKSIVTLKVKHIREGIEESREIEYSVDSPDEFERFAEGLDYDVVVRKTKVGRRYALDGITVELSQVHLLGSFIELELLLDENADNGEIQEARARLLKLLDSLGIDRRDLEPRPYVELLLDGA